MTGFVILLPIVGGLINLLDKKGEYRHIYTAILLGMETILLALNAMRQSSALSYEFVENIRIVLLPDNISHIFAILSAALFLLVSIYAYSYFSNDRHLPSFYCFYFLTLGALVGLYYAKNMFTFYMFFELMTVFSVPLVLHDRTKEALIGAYTYLFYSIFGAGLALFGMFFMNRFCGGNLDFVRGGSLDMSLVSGNENLVYIVGFLMILGYAAKAGAFPLNAWLPVAHPVAPAPASAVLSGVITKAGVMGVIRMCFFVLGEDFLRGTKIQVALIGVALITIVMGSVLALKTDFLKKRLAFSSISQVSYVLFGVFLLSDEALYASIYQVVFHAVGKVLLFISIGSIIHITEKTDASQLDGVGRALPFSMGAFAVGALSLVGIPPAGGFIAKWKLALSALFSGNEVLAITGIAVLILSAVLTAAYLFAPVLKGFFSDIGYTERMEENKSEIFVFTVLSLVILVGGGATLCLL